jgi:hypothetical protein
MNHTGVCGTLCLRQARRKAESAAGFGDCADPVVADVADSVADCADPAAAECCCVLLTKCTIPVRAAVFVLALNTG